MASNDRRDLACLALALTLWGAVLAPLVHQLGHTHTHHHAAPALEHHQVALVASPALPHPRLVLVATGTAAVVAPQTPWVHPFPLVERPQGP